MARFFQKVIAITGKSVVMLHKNGNFSAFFAPFGAFFVCYTSLVLIVQNNLRGKNEELMLRKRAFT